MENVTLTIVAHLDEYVRTPTLHNTAEMKQQFCNITNFPGEIGVVDGTIFGYNECKRPPIYKSKRLLFNKCPSSFMMQSAD